MLEGLYSAAAGMAAQQEQLSAIGNDLANVNTTGYQSERVAFSDLLYSPTTIAADNASVGAGAGAAVIGRSETQGALQETGDPLDLAIDGPGYFQVTRPNGQHALTRDGALAIDANGSLTTSGGALIYPPVKLPAGTEESQVQIAPDGTVSARGRKVGQVQLVTVPSPQHLLAAGESELLTNAASGPVSNAKVGLIRQGALESSNVDLGREMATMVTTQRDYQLDSSAIQNESQMMAIANQLRPA